LIGTQTAVSVSSDGKVSTAILSDQSEIEDISSRIRQMVTGQIGDASAVIKRLEQLGIASNGNDNTIALSDSSTLDNVLNNNLGSVQNVFTDTQNGIADKLSGYIDSITGDEGLISRQQSNFNKQSSSIDAQIAQMEKLIESTKEQMTESFIQMESAQATINQQLQFLSQKFGITTSNS
jgi:flagellar hook-associated protein 2